MRSRYFTVFESYIFVFIINQTLRPDRNVTGFAQGVNVKIMVC